MPDIDPHMWQGLVNEEGKGDTTPKCGQCPCTWCVGLVVDVRPFGDSSA